MIPLSKRISILASLQEILGNNFGRTVTQQHDKYVGILKSKLSLNIILEKIETNKYSAIDEIISDFTLYFNKMLKILGRDTALGLATQDLKKQIFSSFRPKETKITNFYEITSNLNALIQNVPDSPDEIKGMLEDKAPIVPRVVPKVEEFERIQKDDVQQITEMLQNVKTDEEALEVMSIVRVFDPDFVKYNRMELCVDELSPFTVKMLQKHFLSEKPH
jgi:hypothetical protein